MSCMNDVVNILQWLGGEILFFSELHVPPLVVAYNLCTNETDRFDQYRSTLAMRREWRFSMSLFKFILNASLINGRAVLSAVSSHDATISDLEDFKIYVSNQLAAAYVSNRNVPWTIRIRYELGASAIPRFWLHSKKKYSHVLLENKCCHGARCYMCKFPLEGPRENKT